MSNRSDDDGISPGVAVGIFALFYIGIKAQINMVKNVFLRPIPTMMAFTVIWVAQVLIVKFGGRDWNFLISMSILAFAAFFITPVTYYLEIIEARVMHGAYQISHLLGRLLHFATLFLTIVQTYSVAMVCISAPIAEITNAAYRNAPAFSLSVMPWYGFVLALIGPFIAVRIRFNQHLVVQYLDAWGGPRDVDVKARFELEQAKRKAAKSSLA